MATPTELKNLEIWCSDKPPLIRLLARAAVAVADLAYIIAHHIKMGEKVGEVSPGALKSWLRLYLARRRIFSRFAMEVRGLDKHSSMMIEFLEYGIHIYDT